MHLKQSRRLAKLRKLSSIFTISVLNLAGLLLISNLKAETVIDQRQIDELRANVEKIGSLIQQNVETVRFDDQGITLLDLSSVNSSGVPLETHKGFLANFVVEGNGGGNLVQEYIALFKVLTDEDKDIQHGLEPELDSEKTVSLISFEQIDMSIWRYFDWEKRTLENGTMRVPACKDSFMIERCPSSLLGHVDIRFSGNVFGPNLIIENKLP